MKTFYWHDYETFGANPRKHRPAQFAGRRTDEQLNPVGDPLVIYCQPPLDDLPEPIACLITGITPQIAQQRGLAEADFAASIHEQFAVPATCGVGYNSIRFDDEVTRHLLYRNFFEPYAREWQHGNSRWDLIDVVRLCYALRPNGIQWPSREDGAPSFRLEDLTEANDLTHAAAHDALSDVDATIALAKLVLQHQPRLFEHCLRMRNKQTARGLLDFVKLTPVLHASGKYHSERGGVAMVLPLCPHPSNNNGVIVYDLSCPPDDLLQLDAEQISDRLFTAQADLPEGVRRVPLKTVHINRAPVLSPISVLKHTDTSRINLDVDQCQRHRQQIKDHFSGLASKIEQVFHRSFEGQADQDVDEALYANLIGRADSKLFPQLRAADAGQIRAIANQFSDQRLTELSGRYLARNHADQLTEAERSDWHQHCRSRLLAEIDGLPRLSAYRQHLAELRVTQTERTKTNLIDQLSEWTDNLERSL